MGFLDWLHGRPAASTEPPVLGNPSPSPVELSDLELDWLDLARELLLRQQELLPLIADVLGITAYDYWMTGVKGCAYPALRTKYGVKGTTRDGQWCWHFGGAPHQPAIVNRLQHPPLPCAPCLPWFPSFLLGVLGVLAVRRFPRLWVSFPIVRLHSGVRAP